MLLEQSDSCLMIDSMYRHWLLLVLENVCETPVFRFQLINGHCLIFGFFIYFYLPINTGVTMSLIFS